MKQYVDICLRAITKHDGEWSKELESYWTEIHKDYMHCNVHMMPQEHIPLWHARAMDKGIPLGRKPEAVANVLPQPKREKVGV